MEIQEKLKRYAENKLAIERLEAENEQLNPEIVDWMAQNQLDKQPTNMGNFSIGKRKVWTYSGEYIQLKEQLDEKKKIEEQTGVATYVEKPQLMFKPKRDEGEKSEGA